MQIRRKTPCEVRSSEYMDEEVLLDAIPIEDMDLVIHPAKLLLIANPENPNIPGASVK